MHIIKVTQDRFNSSLKLTSAISSVKPLLLNVAHESGVSIFVVYLCIIKGIVHPKMKILSLINHPHVVPNP